MKFAYEDMGSDQFEELVVLLCRRLFGAGVKGFARGPDGGQDARFIGTAEQFPSRSSPWVGSTVIQAKNTFGYNKSFSETDFHNPKSENSVIAKELPRIKKLRDNGRLDHYMLVSNRKLSAYADAEISDFISETCKIPTSSIFLGGVEFLEGCMKEFPEVAERSGLDPIDSPLIVSPDDLAEVVEALARYDGISYGTMEDPPTPRISYREKNTINNMSFEYAKIQQRRYLKDTRQIQQFLAAPENQKLQEVYRSAVEEFELAIVAKRKNHQTFDEIMNHLAILLIDRDPILRRQKRLTRSMLFYMYWNCDIGSEEYAETDETLSPR